MKQITKNSIFIALAMMLTFSEAHADAWTQSRKNCWGFLSWRYLANSRVKQSYTWATLQSQQQGKCSGTAQAYSRQGPPNGPRGEAQAWRGSNTNNTWAFTNWHAYTPGFDANILFQKALSVHDADGGEATSQVDSDLDFLEDPALNDVRATSVNGTLSIKNLGNADFYATYEIIAWAPAGTDYDEAITPEKILWHSSITLTKDGVTGTGLFEAQGSYTMETLEDGTISVRLNLPLGIYIDLPEGQTVELYTRSHTGIRNIENAVGAPARNENEMKAQEQQLLNAYNLEQFEVYPVPSNAETHIDLVTKADDHVVIEVYDYTGKKIRTLCDKDVKGNVKEEFELKPDADLQRGRYQVLVRVGNRTFTRPILVE